MLDEEVRKLDDESGAATVSPKKVEVVDRHSDKIIRWKIARILLWTFAIVVVLYLVSPLIVAAFIPWSQHALVMGEIKDVMSFIFTTLCGFLTASLTFYYGANKGLTF